ncbi:MAG: hypothetical protein EOP54_17240 [Sphingobacteriales bacterium]|nr:MAG: hypothetical protein EOP54_17240 [Sphingobacteriales bacterium]
MKQQDVFKKIGGILKELNEQYEYLSEDAEQLNELELELFAANANFLKDHTEILRKLNVKTEPKQIAAHATVIALPPAVETAPTEPVKQEYVMPEPVKPEPIKQEPELFKPEPVKPSPVSEEKFFEPVVQRVTPGLTAEDEQETTVTETGEPETIRHELIIDDADTWEDEDEELYGGDDIVEEEPENEGVIEEPAPEPEPVTAITTPEVETVEPEEIVEEPQMMLPVIESTVTVDGKNDEPVVTINQRISVQMGEKKNPALSPVTDLKSAINLNDKLLFVKDLFNGYSLAYSEAIEILNRFHSFEEAERFLNANYVTKNNWESKPATTERFYALLRRRYA